MHFFPTSGCKFFSSLVFCCIHSLAVCSSPLSQMRHEPHGIADFCTLADFFVSITLGLHFGSNTVPACSILVHFGFIWILSSLLTEVLKCSWIHIVKSMQLRVCSFNCRSCFFNVMCQLQESGLIYGTNSSISDPFCQHVNVQGSRFRAKWLNVPNSV